MDFVKNWVKHQLRDIIDTNGDGNISVDDVLVLLAQAVKKALPHIERQLDLYLEEQGAQLNTDLDF